MSKKKAKSGLMPSPNHSPSPRIPEAKPQDVPKGGPLNPKGQPPQPAK